MANAVAKQAEAVMLFNRENARIERIGDRLTIEVDLSKTTGPSGSGKNMGIASTRGNKDLGGFTVSLNVYRPFADGESPTTA